MRFAISRRLVPGHQVWKRPLPQSIVLQQHGLQRPRQISTLLARELNEVLDRLDRATHTS